MNYKQILLAVAAVFIMAVFFNSSPYDKWYEERIRTFGAGIYEEIDRLDLESRKEARWSAAYILCKSIKERRPNIGDSLILTPHGNYSKRFGAELFMPEPITAYYFSGIRTVYHKGKYPYKAKLALLLDQTSYSLVPVTDTSIISQVIKMYDQPIK